MARSFLFLAVALATATAVLGPSSAIAQPAISPTGSTTGTAAPAPKSPASAKLEEAIKQLSKGDLNGCLKLLHEAGMEDTKLPSEYMLMYRFMAQAGHPADAKNWVEQAAYKTRSDPEPWIVLGLIALNENRMAEGELDFAKANELLGPYKNADRKPLLQEQLLLNMASAAERRENWPLAQHYLEDYLKSVPDDVVAWERLARSKFWQGTEGSKEKLQEAYDDLKKANKVDAENVAKKKYANDRMLPAAAVLAQYYDSFDQVKKPKYTGPNATSDQFFKYALEKNRDNLQLRAVVADWALHNGKIDLAKEQAKEALRIEKENPKFSKSTVGRALSGYVAMWDKNWPAAKDNFQQLWIEAPADARVKNNLALALVELGDKERALNLAFDNYRSNRDTDFGAEVGATLLWVCYKADKFQEAEQAKDFVLQKSGGRVNDPDTITYLCHVLYHEGNKAKVKEILKPLIESGRPFSMKPEAQKLYDLVKDESAPSPTATTKTP